MRRRFARVFLAIALLSVVICGLFLVIDPTRISQIAGAEMIVSGTLCDDDGCRSGTAVELPYFSTRRQEPGLTTSDFVFAIRSGTPADGVHVIYLPRFDDDIAISLNGTAIRAAARSERHWNKPLILPVPSSLFADGGNVIRLSLTGYAQQGIELQPFFIGPRGVLQGSYDRRYITTTFVARFGLGLMVVLTLVFAVIWLGQRNERIYAYLAASCLTAAMICAHFGLDTSALGYKFWMIVWGYATPVYVLLVAKIVGHHLRISLGRAERIGMLMIAGIVAVALLVPDGWSYAYVVHTNLLTAIGAAMTCTWFWLQRHRASRVDFIVMFGCMSVAVLLGINLLYMLIWPAPIHSLNVYQFMPIVMTGMCLWLIISRLLQSLKDYEALTLSQQDTIAAKTSELERSYRQLAATERRKAIGDERQRIMLDLHDGLGGHLVNALAYMENKGLDDVTLRRALEDALQDLALMLDSLETEDSIATLLGMLRTRLETLLHDHGIEFVWQIVDEPPLPKPGPSQNLTLLRIVQEAITNVVKHADADSITIASNSHSVTIRDNGRGFDSSAAVSGRSGHGILSMRKRAEQIGAGFHLSSSETGTEIRLQWAEPDPVGEGRQRCRNPDCEAGI